MMFLRQMKVSNFKSFEEIQIDFGRFNVLIGANASGKSNFVSVFTFLKDIVEGGLDNALSLQGKDYVRNINLDSSRPLSIELLADIEEKGMIIPDGKSSPTQISPLEFSYKFAIEFPGRKYKIIEEELDIRIEIVCLDRVNGEFKETGTPKRGKVVFLRENGKIEQRIDDNIKEVEKYSVSPIMERILRHPLEKRLFLESEIPFFLLPIDYQLRDFIRTISLYNFDPKLSKLATQIAGPSELKPDGSNLAIVLKNILEDRKEKEKFISIVKNVLPFIEDINVEKLMDKSLIASLKETYSKQKNLPAFLISDGTVNITALIIALYFEKKPLLIFEEPERNIHPYLISRVIEMMKDVSEDMKKRQIIITTHNPEVVKYAEIDHLLFMYRDENGFSRISRPSEKEHIKTFLENDMSLEELYVHNLLEW